MNIQTKIDGQSREEAHSSDFVLWAIEQGRLLRDGRFDELDIANLFDAVDDLGRARRYEFRSRLETLIEHGVSSKTGLCSVFGITSRIDIRNMNKKSPRHRFILSIRCSNMISFRNGMNPDPCTS